jgi:hypothetical protein
MMRDFDVRFGAPRDGWMTVKVVAGEQEWQEDVSDVPCDSIRCLVSSLSMLLQDRIETTVDWSLEPEYSQWIFRRNGSCLDFAIKDSARTNPRLVYRANAREFVHRIIKALCDLATLHDWSDAECPAASWSWPFPKAELLQLRSAWVTTFKAPFQKSN